MFANFEYWWHTPKLCRKRWPRIKRIPLSVRWGTRTLGDTPCL